MDPPASAATTAATEQWEEIWRPRRRGRAVEGAEHGKRAPDRPRPAHRPPQEAKGKHHHPQKGKDRPRRPDRRRGPGERPERPRMPLHASPPPKAGADPDSPFAALSSLKAALEKRSQD
jgi:ATP-dependent RNA helicase SUPV3L1/SUV3